jgi:demethylmenaquinone methyltransferase/2-methoxy-6-polyprenyl-1,4-benzoquinol methylase
MPARADEEDGLAFHVADANGGYDRDMDEATAQRLIEEQQRYYRARAPEYDDWWLRRGQYDLGEETNVLWRADLAELEQALERFAPRGDVLELAAGTGLWTRHLARFADHLTAVDAAPETLELNRGRVGGAVEYVAADLFAWEPDRLYDACFFGFWLSHVPSTRFAEFWRLVDRALKPDGRVLFVDNATQFPGLGTRPTGEESVLRRVADGREFEIVKRFYEPAWLEQELATLGWRATVEVTANGAFLCGSAVREPADALAERRADIVVHVELRAEQG